MQDAPPSEDSTSSSASSSRASTPDIEDVAAYETLMADLLGIDVTLKRAEMNDINMDESEEVVGLDGVSRPMTKAEKQNAKKKRRKERERAAKGVDVTGAAVPLPGQAVDEQITSYDFRLFSSVPVRPVTIRPANEDYQVTENPRHRQYTSEEQRELRQAAIETAVEFPQLGGPSNVHPRWTRSDTTPRELVLCAPTAKRLPNLIVGNVHPPHSSSATPHAQPPSDKLAVASLDLKPAIDSDASRPSTRAKTRRGRKYKAAVVARFYAPPPGLGGKARGYAWGWRDSVEGRREVGAYTGYVRSKGR